MNRRQSGFSLVEVAIALGLVSFVLVALLALFSTMLELGRAARESLVLSTITRNVVAEFSIRDWAALNSSGTETDEIDAFGLPIDSGASLPVAYRVAIEPVNPPDATLPADALDQIRRFQITVTRADGNRPLRVTPFSVANYEN